MNTSLPVYEAERQIRCPKLGHLVSFEYCRLEQAALPCTRALECWSAFFDAETYFRLELSPDEFVRCFLTAPQPKILTLMELIDNARKSVNK
jgi:hypothetical protein